MYNMIYDVDSDGELVDVRYQCRRCGGVVSELPLECLYCTAHMREDGGLR